ncbi:hypothetical protein SERLA73DRAFT_135552 [Serpula lacrymans var. lacrymans S7.3]|uniref:CxC2-like cysteine cluster KDZ transposase-associated domain-containing protein n=2 Tax=Serpula lacrymans var. lacrymans TaxID=341189 RepID=F8PU35_SERL3|nr:uncharacterized protein SERLADRAFT_387652 [Serpula lacrymans var. lacrymans S7.9]EGN99974.1 hypothetical protein SERLA73DRAFT_135552 [Serpula lacrymans var. lacrymans S7.3]EGO25539.1 hypothetical protein SERLADRAFT_387652 [Serpula lacrymans var. lacrymans S7.9]
MQPSVLTNLFFSCGSRFVLAQLGLGTATSSPTDLDYHLTRSGHIKLAAMNNCQIEKSGLSLIVDCRHTTLLDIVYGSDTHCNCNLQVVLQQLSSSQQKA